jgi:hypothetical protein
MSEPGTAPSNIIGADFIFDVPHTAKLGLFFPAAAIGKIIFCLTLPPSAGPAAQASRNGPAFFCSHSKNIYDS